MKIKAAPPTGAEFEGYSEPPALSPIKLHRILVPTDFKECSRKALSYALSFARQFGGEILLLHVVESMTAMEQDSLLQTAALTDAVREESKRRLARWQRKARGEAPVKTMLCEGLAWQRIVAVAGAKKIDLIVAGTGGRSGLARVLLGSTSEQVVRHAPCPVLVVREREHDFLNPRELSRLQPAPGL
jgi:universal stress protein A